MNEHDRRARVEAARQALIAAAVELATADYELLVSDGFGKPSGLKHYAGLVFGPAMQAFADTERKLWNWHYGKE